MKFKRLRPQLEYHLKDITTEWDEDKKFVVVRLHIGHIDHAAEDAEISMAIFDWQRIAKAVDGTEEIALVPEAKFREMEKRIALLDALEAGGVDNWDWYEESTRHLYNDEEDE